MTELPKGWTWATLGEIGEYANGRGFKKSEWSMTGRPIIRIQNLTGSGTNYNYYDGELEDKYVVRAGDLLISWAATLGSFIWDGPEGVLNQHIFKVQSHVDQRFHRYLVDYLIDELYRHTHGSGMVHVTRSKFMDLKFGLPPLAEQRRIIAAFEDHLSRLDAAKRFIDNAQRRARTLWKSSINRLLSAFEDFSIEPLSRLLREPLRNGHSGRATTDSSGVRTLTLTAVTKGQFSEEYTKLADVGRRRIDGLWLESGDIFIQRSNTPDLVGTSALYLGQEDWAIFPDLLIRIRTNEKVTPEYVHLVLSSARVRDQLRNAAKGLAGSMPKIDQGAVAAVQIPVPEISDQNGVVEHASFMQAGIERMEQELAKAMIRRQRLRQSLLVEAFAGRLVPQDPNDEPASVLLERIRTERAAQPKPKRTRRATEPTQETLL